MRCLLLSLFLTLFSTAHAQSSEGPCSLELGMGVQNIEIMNPNTSKSVFDGYGGTLTARYNAVSNENFHFALRLSAGYTELENKANTASLHESLHNTSWGPGVELRVHSFFVGAEYQNNKTTIELGGSSSSSVHTSFYSPQFFLGFDVPMDWWGFRLYYMRSEGDVPRLDTGLAQDSPWKQEQFVLAFRINFRHKKADPYRYNPSYDSQSFTPTPAPAPSETNVDTGRTYRPVRYSPRPSRNLGN